MRKFERTLTSRFKFFWLYLLLIPAFALGLTLMLIKPGNAHVCAACLCKDTDDTEDLIELVHHPNGEQTIVNAWRERFHQHREWIVPGWFTRLIIPSLMLMTEQMSNIGMMQMMVVGKLYDAKLHLEAQRLFNELQNEANKDYYPSDSFCWFGTNVRALSHSERLSQVNQLALSQIKTTRNMGTLNNLSASSEFPSDKLGRWRQFTGTYCDPHDNAWIGGDTGLSAACGAGAADKSRTNKDIDYTRAIDGPRTLSVYFPDATSTAEEQDIIALGRNLYGHNHMIRNIPGLNQESGQKLYFLLRSVNAKRNVAENSYNTIVGLKSKGSNDGNGAQFLKAIVKDLGMTDSDIEQIFGENPSYYAQLEILGKRIFQNADFFTDLYDKPANVKRKRAALTAFEMLLDRAIYESELRHEMIMSVLLSANLDAERRTVYRDFVAATKDKR